MKTYRKLHPMTSLGQPIDILPDDELFELDTEAETAVSPPDDDFIYMTQQNIYGFNMAEKNWGKSQILNVSMLHGLIWTRKPQPRLHNPKSLGQELVSYISHRSSEQRTHNRTGYQQNCHGSIYRLHCQQRHWTDPSASRRTWNWQDTDCRERCGVCRETSVSCHLW